MAKTLSKEISKLQKVPHPKGRKAAQLTKKSIKIASREKVKFSHHVKTNLLGEKLMWFKENLDPEAENYTPDKVTALIEKYLGRFNEELEQINLKHNAGKRKGRQHANREDIINMTVSRERQEFETCGFEVPHLLNSKQLELLKKWNGELRYLQHFKFVRYSRDKLSKWKAPVVKQEKIKAKEIVEEKTVTGNLSSTMDIDEGAI